MTTTVIALGLVCWLATSIVVESEIFRPLRVWVSDQKYKAQHGHAPPRHAYGINIFSGLYLSNLLKSFTRGPVHPRRHAVWTKVSYLLTCHLCAGTWIALGLVTVQPDTRPFGTGFVGWLLAGLIVKAIAHVTLEVVAVLKEYTRPVS